MKTRSALLTALLMLACTTVACSGSVASGNIGSSSVNGTVAGQPAAEPTDEIGLTGTQTMNGISASYAGAVVTTNVKGACGLIQQNGNPASATALSVVVVTTGTSVAAGTYNISATGTTNPNGTVMQASARYYSSDANCAPVINEAASMGTITINGAGPSVVSGSFDVTFPGGDHLTGSFSSPVCSVNLTTLGQTSPGACTH
jgi:hypothetical protein